MTAASNAAGFPIDAVRARFPALADDGPIFLDNPAGTQVPSNVIAAIVGAMTESCANLGGAFSQSRAAGEIVATAHDKAALFLDATSSEEIVIGPSMTELTMHAARSMARSFAPGDEVVVTTMDHEGNVSPWLIAARDFGLSVRWVRFDRDTWRIEPEALLDALSSRTRLVAMNYASNMTGSINDVRTLVEIAKDAGALAFVDAVQFAPHELLDVQALGCDFLVCSAYKFFGPHLGILWGRRELLERLTADRLRCGPTGPAEKFERGTPQIELQAGLIAAIEHFEWLGRQVGGAAGGRAAIAAAFEASKEYETVLVRRLIEGLREIPGVSIKGISNPNRLHDRVPTVSFTCPPCRSAALAAALAKDEINVWSGHNYAFASAEQLRLDPKDGVLRIGIAHYNQIDEIDRTLSAITRSVHAQQMG